MIRRYRRSQRKWTFYDGGSVEELKAKALKHSRTKVTGREVYLGPRGEYGHAEYFHLILPSRQLGFSWINLERFERKTGNVVCMVDSERNCAIYVGFDAFQNIFHSFIQIVFHDTT